MATQEVQEERVKSLNEEQAREGGDYVLYWMQASQRAGFNPALEYAVEQANALKLPLWIAGEGDHALDLANATRFGLSGGLISDDPALWVRVKKELRAGVLNPLNALNFFYVDGFRAFVAMGSVVLAVTGAEALYADMGHFGRAPIGISWMAFVLPALMLNYMGQGAMLLSQPLAQATETVKNPFFFLAPEAFRLPLVILATAVTVIASLAVITGASTVGSASSCCISFAWKSAPSRRSPRIASPIRW